MKCLTTSWKYLNLLLSTLIVVTMCFLSYNLVNTSIANQKVKLDYAELNNIRYGLFSIDVWKQKLSTIIRSEINKMDFTRNNERIVKKHIESMLNTLIDKVVQKIKQDNKGSVVGWIKQTLMNFLVNVETIKQGIPEYSDAILKEITAPKTKKEIKGIVKKQAEKYIQKTFGKQDGTVLEKIFQKWGAENIEDAKKKVKEEIAKKQSIVLRDSIAIIVLGVLLFGLTWLNREPWPGLRFLFLLIGLLALLVGGVTTPMIDLEAKIQQMNFVLVGYSIEFSNQVLYFQSKSIVDVFWIMITNAQVQMKAVGVLVVAFSIIFPLVKMISALLYYYGPPSLKQNALVDFFVFKSGKWSMADVLVIAIFMAYIGFSGVITSQLEQLQSTVKSENLMVLTTDATTLQPGFYIFLSYALLSLFFTGMLKKMVLEEEKNEPEPETEPISARRKLAFKRRQLRSGTVRPRKETGFTRSA